MHELARHKLAYGILVVLLGTFVLAFLRAWPDHTQQRILAVAFGISYLIWGVTAHVKASRLTRHIFFEYLAMAILATVALLVITF